MENGESPIHGLACPNRHDRIGDRLVRRRVVSGAMVVMAAMVGLDVVALTQRDGRFFDRSAVVVMRSRSAGSTGGLNSATGLGWTAAGLLLVLASRRIPWSKLCLILSPMSRTRFRVAEARQDAHRAWTVSYHMGGLYGP